MQRAYVCMKCGEHNSLNSGQLSYRFPSIVSEALLHVKEVICYLEALLHVLTWVVNIDVRHGSRFPKPPTCSSDILLGQQLSGGALYTVRGINSHRLMAGTKTSDSSVRHPIARSDCSIAISATWYQHLSYAIDQKQTPQTPTYSPPL